MGKTRDQRAGGGERQYRAMPLEELEHRLPITVEREERKNMPCPDCKRNCMENVVCEQRVYRSDDFFNGQKTRSYEIAFVRQYSREPLFRTSRCHSLREALVEAHMALDRMGLKPSE